MKVVGEVVGAGRVVGQAGRAGSVGTLVDAFYLWSEAHPAVPASRDAVAAWVASVNAWFSGGSYQGGRYVPAPRPSAGVVAYLVEHAAAVMDRGRPVACIGLGHLPAPGQVTDPAEPWVGTTLSTSAPGSAVERTGPDGPWWAMAPGRWWGGAPVERGQVVVLLDDGSEVRLLCYGLVEHHPLSVAMWQRLEWRRGKAISGDWFSGLFELVRFAAASVTANGGNAASTVVDFVGTAAELLGSGDGAVGLDDVVEGGAVEDGGVWLTMTQARQVVQLYNALAVLALDDGASLDDVVAFGLQLAGLHEYIAAAFLELA